MTHFSEHIPVVKRRISVIYQKSDTERLLSAGHRDPNEMKLSLDSQSNLNQLAGRLQSFIKQSQTVATGRAASRQDDRTVFMSHTNLILFVLPALPEQLAISYV
jgi:hypothetical protein